MKGSGIGENSAMESLNTISVPGEHGIVEGVAGVHEPSAQASGAELIARALASPKATSGFGDVELPWMAR